MEGSGGSSPVASTTGMVEAFTVMVRNALCRSNSER